jgi:hypothetical protein
MTRPLASSGLRGFVAAGLLSTALVATSGPVSSAAATPAAAAAPSATFRVATYNIHANTTNSTTWPTQRSNLLREIGSYAPDVIGIQEAGSNATRRTDFRNGMQSHGYTTAADYATNSRPIYWKTASFQILRDSSGNIASGTVVVGGSAAGKTASWVALKHIASGREIVVANVHLTSSKCGLTTYDLDATVSNGVCTSTKDVPVQGGGTRPGETSDPVRGQIQRFRELDDLFSDARYIAWAGHDSPDFLTGDFNTNGTRYPSLADAAVGVTIPAAYRSGDGTMRPLNDYLWGARLRTNAFTVAAEKSGAAYNTFNDLQRQNCSSVPPVGCDGNHIDQIFVSRAQGETTKVVAVEGWTNKPPNADLSPAQFPSDHNKVQIRVTVSN